MIQFYEIHEYMKNQYLKVTHRVLLYSRGIRPAYRGDKSITIDQVKQLNLRKYTAIDTG